MRIRLLELEMVRIFESTAKNFAPSLCNDMPEGMVKCTENAARKDATNSTNLFPPPWEMFDIVLRARLVRLLASNCPKCFLLMI
jgi:hypothetical protein